MGDTTRLRWVVAQERKEIARLRAENADLSTALDLRRQNCADLQVLNGALHKALVQELLDTPDVQRIETHPATKRLIWITYLGLQPANEIAEQCALVVSKHAVKGE